MYSLGVALFLGAVALAVVLYLVGEKIADAWVTVAATNATASEEAAEIQAAAYRYAAEVNAGMHAPDDPDAEDDVMAPHVAKIEKWAVDKFGDSAMAADAVGMYEAVTGIVPCNSTQRAEYLARLRSLGAPLATG